jgi:hypothetical protein
MPTRGCRGHSARSWLGGLGRRGRSRGCRIARRVLGSRLCGYCDAGLVGKALLFQDTGKRRYRVWERVRVPDVFERRLPDAVVGDAYELDLVVLTRKCDRGPG